MYMWTTCPLRLCLCYTNPFCDQHNIVSWKMLLSLSANQKSVLHSTDQWGTRHHVTSHPQPWQLPGVSTKPVLSVPCPSLVTTNFPKFWQKPIVNQGRGEVSPSSLPVTSHLPSPVMVVMTPYSLLIGQLLRCDWLKYKDPATIPSDHMRPIA